MVWGMQGGHQVGLAYHRQIAGFGASVWSGSAQSWVDLHPTGAQTSIAYSNHGNRQVGYARFNDREHAALWSGSAGSFVDLHPAGSDWSIAQAVHGVHQVGGVVTNGIGHAILWRGSPQSRIDLHPAGAMWSAACGVHGDTQVGCASPYGAGLWRGSADSWVTLPGGAVAYATDGQQHVGWTGGEHAILWPDSAGSWVDLNPSGAVSSVACGVHAGVQVGFARIGWYNRAGIWHGTAQSWEDISGVVPGSWTDTNAMAIWSDARTLYVGGSGMTDDDIPLRRAFLWSRPLTASEREAARADDEGETLALCYANCDGSTSPPTLNVADFTCFLQRFAARDPYANCDGSTQPPVLNVADFTCFLQSFAAGCP